MACVLVGTSTRPAVADNTHGPLGPYVITAGGIDGLPRQAGYCYRVWTPSVVGAATVTVTWTGSSEPAVVLTGGSGTMRVGATLWRYAGRTYQPADSESVALSGGGSSYLFECVGRAYAAPSGGSLEQFAVGDWDTGATWEVVANVSRKADENIGTWRTAVPVIPGQAYRVNAEISCTGSDDVLKFTTRAPGAGDVGTGALVGGFGALVAPPSAGANWLHDGEEAGCGGDGGWFTCGYGLRSDFGETQAGGAVGANVITMGWVVDHQGGSLPSNPTISLVALYVLPVGFTLRESTGGTAGDGVWQDAPSISSGDRMILDKLQAIYSQGGNGGSYSSTDLSNTTSGVVGTGITNPTAPTVALGNNLPTSLAQTNYTSSGLIAAPEIGFSFNYLFEMFPTASGHIYSKMPALVETLNNYRLAIRELCKWIISLAFTLSYLFRIFGG